MTNNFSRFYPFALVLAGACFYVPFLGYAPLFDGPELRLAEAAREMLVTNTYGYAQLNFLPDWSIAPLLPWLQALSMRVFGVADNAELATRLPSALLGILTLLTLFLVGKKKHDARFGLFWALSYLGAVTPLVLAKSGLTATGGQLFAFLGLLYLFEINSVAELGVKTRQAILAGIFLGLSILANGLAMNLILLCLIPIWQWRMGSVRSLSGRFRFIVVGCMVLVASPWLVPALKHAPISELLVTPDWWSIVYALLAFVGFGPALMLAVDFRQPTAQQTAESSQLTPFRVVLLMGGLLLLSVFRPELILLAFFFISYQATQRIQPYLDQPPLWQRSGTLRLIGWSLLVGLLMLVVPVIGLNAERLALTLTNPFWTSILQSPVDWAGWEWVIGIVFTGSTSYFILQIRKSGVRALAGLYGSTAFCTLLYLVAVLPKIEQYLQGPLINFCESKWNQSVYVQTTFPSAAPLFYTRKKPPVAPESRSINWLLNGPVDRLTFIITKVPDADQYRYNPNLELLQEENGYVVFKRKQYR